MKKQYVSVLLLSLGCQLEDPVAHTDHPLVGMAGNQGDAKSVFALQFSRQTYESGDIAYLGGTGTNVRYPRCILTAAGTGGTERAQIKSGPSVDVSSKSQAVAVRVPHPDHIADLYNAPQGYDETLHNLAILWIQQKTGADMLLEADYNPVDISPGPAAVGDQTIVYGFGDNDSNYVDFTYSANYGDGVLRWAGVRIDEVVHGPMLIPAQAGGRYEGLRWDGEPFEACGADLGGPVAVNGGITQGVIGVIADDGDAACDGASWHGVYITALTDHSPIDGKKSNWDWVNETIELTCGKSLYVEKHGGGRVEGNISRAQSVANGTSLNGNIRCGDNLFAITYADCKEIIHADQSMTLTATPALGWSFKRWEGTCPAACLYAGAPTCTVSYDAMGHYGAGYSYDFNVCKAVFEQLVLPMPMPLPMPTSPTTTGGF